MSFLTFFEKKIRRKLDTPPVSSTSKVDGVSDGSECFSEEYHSLISECDANILNLSRQLGVQHRFRSKAMQYLVKNKFFFKKEGKKKPKKDEHRHSTPLRCTFFVGGKAHFPFCNWKSLYLARAQDVLADVLLFDNDISQSNEGIRMFLEMDYTSKNRIFNTEEMLEHGLECQRILRKFFPHADVSFWLLVSPPKSKITKKCLQPLLKCGAHIVFPHIVVNCEKGKQLCHSINLGLNLKLNLVDVVDNCFKTNHACLRPVWSRKLTDCVMCHNSEEERHQCEMCAGRGKVAHGAVYTPWCLVDNKCQVQLYQHTTNLKKLAAVLEVTSIVPPRQNMFTPGYVHPVDEPFIVPPEERCKKQTSQNHFLVSRTDNASQKKMRFKRMVEITDPERIEYVQLAIQSYGRKHGIYNDAVISSIRENSKKEIYVDLQSRDRTLCRISSAQGYRHRSNRVFFVLSKRTRNIHQSCYKKECRDKLSNTPGVKKGLESVIPAPLYSKIF
jgi:hypothetical protein